LLDRLVTAREAIGRFATDEYCGVCGCVSGDISYCDSCGATLRAKANKYDFVPSNADPAADGKASDESIGA
jgi:hypothetical protein